LPASVTSIMRAWENGQRKKYWMRRWIPARSPASKRTLWSTLNSLADGGFLAACIAVADRLANIGSTYLPDVKTLNPPVEKSAEWFFLSQFATEKPFDVDLKAEIERAEQDLNAFSAK